MSDDQVMARITELERQIIVLHTKIATRDLALGKFLEGMLAAQVEAAATWTEGWSQTMTDADASVAKRFLTTPPAEEL